MTFVVRGAHWYINPAERSLRQATLLGLQQSLLEMIEAGLLESIALFHHSWTETECCCTNIRGSLSRDA